MGECNIATLWRYGKCRSVRNLMVAFMGPIFAELCSTPRKERSPLTRALKKFFAISC